MLPVFNLSSLFLMLFFEFIINFYNIVHKIIYNIDLIIG